MYLHEITILKFAKITCNDYERHMINDRRFFTRIIFTGGKNIERWIEHGWI